MQDGIQNIKLDAAQEIKSIEEEMSSPTPDMGRVVTEYQNAYHHLSQLQRQDPSMGHLLDSFQAAMQAFSSHHDAKALHDLEQLTQKLTD